MSDHLESDLRAITLDASDNAPPKTLRLEEMFTRVQAWGDAHRSRLHQPDEDSPSSTRPSSPTHEPRQPYPLPMPLEQQTLGVSPIAGIIAYPELLPLVVGHFEHPRELAVLCRVSRDVQHLAQKKLYERIWIRPWEEGCRLKVRLQVAMTHLARSPLPDLVE